ncbi:MAG: tRNA (cytidine(34)-2'-O)-methyltransferase [Eubacteriales bacterium]|nr:tRNA (cytidine(34)-2'-O)-methyltransferase [Eubacteriales bacterium]
MNIVLLAPEIPFNTGAIGRTCVATDSTLHLIRPLGFSLEDKYIKRSGLDYWSKLRVRVYDNYETFLIENDNPTVYMATTKARRTYADVRYAPADYIMFGRESAGIPEELLTANEEHCIRIPMAADNRSLNLSNAVAVILYEALRQQAFSGLSEAGDLHRLQWPSSGKV